MRFNTLRPRTLNLLQQELESHLVHRRLSAQTSGSARRRARERRLALLTREEGERIARERREQRQREKIEQQRMVSVIVKTPVHNGTQWLIGQVAIARQDPKSTEDCPQSFANAPMLVRLTKLGWNR